MNKLFLFFILFSYVGLSQEVFHVLHVKGEIYIDTSKVPIRTGDEFKGDVKLKFGKNSDKAVILSNLRGRLVLFKRQIKNRESEFYYYLKNNILPVKEFTATRSQNDNKTLLYFKDGRLLLSKKIMVFKIPENSDSYYTLEYSTKEKIFNEKININKDELLELNSNNMNFAAKNIKVEEITEIVLKYYDNKKNQFFEMKNLNFVCLSLENIHQELTIYKTLLRGKYSDVVIKSKLQEFLEEVYDSEIRLDNFEII